MWDKSQLKAMVDNRSDDNKSVDHLISNKVSETQQKSVVIKKEPKNWDKIVKQFEAQNKQQKREEDKEEEQSFDNVVSVRLLLRERCKCKTANMKAMEPLFRWTAKVSAKSLSNL